MAAIAGILGRNGHTLEGCSKQMWEMLEQMRHRGPDNTIMRSLPDGRGALGANEINLTAQRTSCTTVSKPPYILFDGELFNERANGQTDVELFQEYYLKYGKQCFELSVGQRAGVLPDRNAITSEFLASEPL